MNSGDIALIHFPFSFNEGQPFKRRPVLVVANSGGNAADGGLLVAMITSSAARIANPGTCDVPLSATATSGLLAPSVCRANRLWVAEDRDFVRVIGQVTLDELERVRTMITGTFGLS